MASEGLREAANEAHRQNIRRDFVAELDKTLGKLGWNTEPKKDNTRVLPIELDGIARADLQPIRSSTHPHLFAVAVCSTTPKNVRIVGKPGNNNLRVDVVGTDGMVQSTQLPEVRKFLDGEVCFDLEIDSWNFNRIRVGKIPSTEKEGILVLVENPDQTWRLNVEGIEVKPDWQTVVEDGKIIPERSEEEEPPVALFDGRTISFQSASKKLQEAKTEDRDGLQDAKTRFLAEVKSIPTTPSGDDGWTRQQQSQPQPEPEPKTEAKVGVVGLSEDGMELIRDIQSNPEDAMNAVRHRVGSFRIVHTNQGEPRRTAHVKNKHGEVPTVEISQEENAVQFVISVNEKSAAKVMQLFETGIQNIDELQKAVATDAKALHKIIIRYEIKEGWKQPKTLQITAGSTRFDKYTFKNVQEKAPQALSADAFAAFMDLVYRAEPKKESEEVVYQDPSKPRSYDDYYGYSAPSKRQLEAWDREERAMLGKPALPTVYIPPTEATIFRDRQYLEDILDGKVKSSETPAKPQEPTSSKERKAQYANRKAGQKGKGKKNR